MDTGTWTHQVEDGHHKEAVALPRRHVACGRLRPHTKDDQRAWPPRPAPPRRTSLVRRGHTPSHARAKGGACCVCCAGTPRRGRSPATGHVRWRGSRAFHAELQRLTRPAADCARALTSAQACLSSSSVSVPRTLPRASGMVTSCAPTRAHPGPFPANPPLCTHAPWCKPPPLLPLLPPRGESGGHHTISPLAVPLSARSRKVCQLSANLTPTRT